MANFRIFAKYSLQFWFVFHQTLSYSFRMLEESQDLLLKNDVLLFTYIFFLKFGAGHHGVVQWYFCKPPSITLVPLSKSQ